MDEIIEHAILTNDVDGNSMAMKVELVTSPTDWDGGMTLTVCDSKTGDFQVACLSITDLIKLKDAIDQHVEYWTR